MRGRTSSGVVIVLLVALGLALALLQQPSSHLRAKVEMPPAPSSVTKVVKVCDGPPAAVDHDFGSDPVGGSGRETGQSAAPRLLKDRITSARVGEAVAALCDQIHHGSTRAGTVAAWMDPRRDPRIRLTRTEWSATLEYIRLHGEWSGGQHPPRLVHQAPPKGSWSDYSTSGHPSGVTFGPYERPGASWFLLVWVPNLGRYLAFRNDCGGQVVELRRGLPDAIKHEL